MQILGTLILLLLHLIMAYAFSTLFTTEENFYMMFSSYLIGALGAALYGNVQTSLKGIENEQNEN